MKILIGSFQYRPEREEAHIYTKNILITYETQPCPLRFNTATDIWSIFKWLAASIFRPFVEGEASLRSVIFETPHRNT